ncbi:MAG: AAA family ATPase [Acidobacteria bacterium]|nr:AAA family ATPase [Acidobacteriota bacterium]
MFLDFYRLREQPFGVTPDLRFLYLSQTHREALASLFYGIEAQRGFLALIAAPGTGKTTLVFQLLERLRSSARTAFLFQTQCDSRELFRHLLGDLGCNTEGLDLVAMHQRLNEILVREMLAGRRFVLVIDEAQNLKDSVLETVRLLSNFETPRTKLLQILLVGQPQLADKLASPGLVQLRQRIAIVARLEPLSPTETIRYIDHRLRVAGYGGTLLFTASALEAIAARSQGIPRNINSLCFSALSFGYALGRRQIDSKMVDEAVADLDVDSLGQRSLATRGLAVRTSSVTPRLSYPLARDSEFGRRPLSAAALAATLILAAMFAASSTGRIGKAIGSRLAQAAVELKAAPAHLKQSVFPAEPILPANSLPSQRGAVEHVAPMSFSGGTSTVVVEPRQTLQQISLRHVGRFNTRLVEEILRLNPKITNPNHIEIGQRIDLPRPSRASEGRPLATQILGKSETTQRKE